MAKRMKSKIQPAELKIALQMRASGYHYVDLSQCASIINRRFYRQGLNWAVSHFTFYKTSPTESGAEGVTVSKLPNTWVMSNAWEKGFRVWQRMINNATDEAGTSSIKGKFLDFKVFMNARHHTAGSAANLLPIDIAANPATPGQWQMSDITIPTQGTGAAVDYELIAIGPNGPGAGASGKDAKSLVQGYADSRALPNIEDPNVPADANTNWYLDIFDDGTAQDAAVTNMLEGTGDKAPYPFEGDGTSTDTMYPGGETQLPAARVVGAAYFNAGNNANKVLIEGDNFPCGLVELYSSTEDTISVIVHLVPGSHRGYLAESMTEM
jgi:hypothetical protein